MCPCLVVFWGLQAMKDQTSQFVPTFRNTHKWHKLSSLRCSFPQNHKHRIPTNSYHSSSDTRSEAMVDTAPHNHFESGLVPCPPPQGCSVSSRDGRRRCPLVPWDPHQDSRGRTTYPLTKPGSSWHLLCPIWSHHILIKESTRFFPVYITSDLPCYWVGKKAIR